MSLEKKREVTGILMISPVLLGILLFFIRPMIQAIIFSFSVVGFQTSSGYVLSPAGFSNYSAALFEHSEYNQNLVSSLLTMVSQVPLIIFFSFFMASVLNQKFKGRAFARVMLFLPVIISSAALMTIDSSDTLQNMMGGSSSLKDTFSAGSGVFSLELGDFLQNLGMAATPIKYITTAVDKIYEIISFSGIQILIFLAGLQSVPHSLYEYAATEGATEWESFWKITFPMVSPMILVVTIYSIIDSFSQYNNSVLQTIETTVFHDQNFGEGAAMSWIYCFIVLIILAIVYQLISKRVYYLDR